MNGSGDSKEIVIRKITRLRFLIMAAGLLAGWLAGVNVERYLVNVPAWRKVDILAWAEFARQAYFPNGFLLFQFEAGGSFILLVISSLIAMRNKFRSVALPLYVSTALACAGILLSFKTVPVMLGIDTLHDNAEQLRAAFEEYHYWGAIRALFQVTSFLACIVAMGRVFVIKYVRS